MKKTVFAKMTAAAALLLLAVSCGQTAAPQADAARIVLDNIATRASVRQFTDQPVEASVMEQILRAGMAAPSAVNKQPWAFVVITEPEQLAALNEVHPYANLKTATAAVIVCGDMDKALEGRAREYWVQDCSAVTENILLAAHALGLGAVWCGVYPSTERVAAVSEVLGLPGSIVPLNIVTMGYPAADVQPKDKWNPDLIHYQRW